MNEASASRSGFVAGAGRRATRWAISALVVVAGWLGGLLLWGPPEQGFRTTSAAFSFIALLTIGLPAVALAGIAEGKVCVRSRVLRMLATLIFGLAVALIAYLASFWHFGGFCWDAEDECVITWSSRIVGLISCLGAVVVGWLIGEVTLIVLERFGFHRLLRTGADPERAE